MRLTYRTRDVKEYTAQSWADIPADKPMENYAARPLKFAEMTVTAKDGPILEEGCSAGRILRHYHERGCDIRGMAFIEVAINKLRKIDPNLKAEVGDFIEPRYADERFKYLLALGPYHNLKSGLDRAIAETWRVLQTNGRVCASFRADNIQSRPTDWLADRRMKARGATEGPRVFHKLTLTRAEYESPFVPVPASLSRPFTSSRTCPSSTGLRFSGPQVTKYSTKTMHARKTIGFPCWVRRCNIS